MPRPNRDRVMVSFYLSRSGKAAIEAVAKQREITKADAYRLMLTYAERHMPAKWEPRFEKEVG